MTGVGWRDRYAWTARGVVPVLLAAYVAGLYAATVLAGRAFLGRTSGAGLGLTVVAAALAAVTLEPLGDRLRRRLPVPPQERLARLARGAVAAADLPDLLAATAHLLQAGLGAVSVEVRRGPAAATGAAGDGSEQVQVVPLQTSGTVLGAVHVTMPPGGRLSPRDRALLAGVAEQVTTVLQTAALRDALRETVAEAELRTADLRRSRHRIALRSYTGRRRVERDIHDGAQQHLVGLAVHLALLRSLLADGAPGTPAALEPARSAALSALAALDDLSRGLYPPRLAEHGLAVALREAAGSSPLHVNVEAPGLPRTDADVEAAVYFCCLEAMQNAARHAQASRVDLRLAVLDGRLSFSVTDDGRGFLASAAAAGAGTQNMRDRLDALGGSLRVASVVGGGTTVSGEVAHVPRQRAGPAGGGG